MTACPSCKRTKCTQWLSTSTACYNKKPIGRKMRDPTPSQIAERAAEIRAAKERRHGKPARDQDWLS